MRSIAIVFAATLGAAALTAQTAPEPRTVGQTLDRDLGYAEKEFVSGVEAMPEARFTFAPTKGTFKGVRTFAQQAKHVAAVNYLVGATLLGEKPPADVGPKGDGPEAMKGKAEVVAYLKGSYVYARKALAAVTPENAVEPLKSPWQEGFTSRLELAQMLQGHTFDHYGQIVVYLRMNGIVPPASR